ncbi:unnamed protein product, partial [Laminaria digitata]
VTITPDSSDFDYTYELDGSPNTPANSNIFSDIATGPHTITVNYTGNIAPTSSVLLLEDFGTGPNTSITEIDPVYCYEPQNGTTDICNSANSRINDGEYSVTQLIVSPFGPWRSPNDHTGNSGGRFLAINIGGVAGSDGIIYAKRGVEIIPNRDITISLEAFNLLRGDIGNTQNDPNVEIQLVDPLEPDPILAVIASTTTGLVPKHMNLDDWHNYTVTLDPGALTNLDIVIRTRDGATSGNDIAIDDIQAFQVPEVCAGSLTVDVNIEDGNAFDAAVTAFSDISCNTGTDGSITFEVENFDVNFEYQVNSGGFSAPQTTSPVNLTGLTAGVYNIDVRTTDNLGNTCSTSFSQTLSGPNALETTASITTVLTCTNGGATITASATGGTPAYEYQLEDGVGGIITGFDYATNGNNTVFTGLAVGDYIVRARDTNLCEDPIDAVITVADYIDITFTSTPTACYSGSNDGTIQVDVTAGNGDYQFSIDGGPWTLPNTSTTRHIFNNLTPGTYTIDVLDGFGCTGVQQNITTNPQLTASAALTNDLTCLVDASVTITAGGGSGSFTYEWSNNGGTNYFNTNFTGNIFTTNTAGTYQFRVTDTTAPTACTVVT